MRVGPIKIIIIMIVVAVVVVVVRQLDRRCWLDSPQILLNYRNNCSATTKLLLLLLLLPLFNRTIYIGEL